jgi:hypothetical protein
MMEAILLALVLLLMMAAAVARWWVWQREQEAKSIVAAIRTGDCGELLILLTGLPRFDLLTAHFGEPALILCVESGAAAEMLELLFDRGADVNERGTEWRTALMHAARLGRADVCRVLLEHGADLRAGDMWGRTAAEIARHNGHECLSRSLEQAAVRAR